MWPWKKKTLSGHLGVIKKVKVKGIRFEIKKYDPLNFLDGSQGMQKTVDVYENKKKNQASTEVSEKDIAKIKRYYADVFLASVVHPKLSRSEGEAEDAIWVEELFSDWDLVGGLYREINEFVYGKKKIQSVILQSQGLQS